MTTTADKIREEVRRRYAESAIAVITAGESMSCGGGSCCTDAGSAGQTSLVAWVPTSGGSDPNRFTVADFAVDPQRTSCTCPNGVVSTRGYAHGAGDGSSLRFLASQCRDCPLWSMCRDADANPKGHRSVFLSD